MKLHHLGIGAMIAAAISLFGVMFEMMSTMPYYVEEPATIRKVVHDPTWGASDWLTLGRFADGKPAQARGDLGNPGETVLMYRERGTSSMLGILGDRRKP
jgi:hypothetical protein